MEDVKQEIPVATPHPFWQHFSKRTLALILVLLAITGGLLYLALKEEQPTGQQKTGQQTGEMLSPAHTTLSFSPPSPSTSAKQSTSILINSNSNKVTVVQLNLGYDPQILSNVLIKPGTYFSNPTILFNNIDKVNGRITYDIAISPTDKQASGSGTVATISYSILPAAAATTKINFLPKTEATQQGISGSILKAATDLTIAIPETLQLSPTASAASH